MIILLLSEIANQNIYFGGRIGTFCYDLNTKYSGYFYAVGGYLDIFLLITENNFGLEGTIGFSDIPGYGGLWIDLYHMLNYPYKKSSIVFGYGFGLFFSDFRSTYFAVMLENNVVNTPFLLLQFNLKLSEHIRDKRLITSFQISIGGAIKF